jgi:hypothetical protein
MSLPDTALPSRSGRCLPTLKCVRQSYRDRYQLIGTTIGGQAQDHYQLKPRNVQHHGVVNIARNRLKKTVEQEVDQLVSRRSMKMRLGKARTRAEGQAAALSIPADRRARRFSRDCIERRAPRSGSAHYPSAWNWRKLRSLARTRSGRKNPMGTGNGARRKGRRGVAARFRHRRRGRVALSTHYDDARDGLTNL